MVAGMPRAVIVALARTCASAVLALGLASCERWPERAPAEPPLEPVARPPVTGPAPPSRPTPLVTEEETPTVDRVVERGTGSFVAPPPAARSRASIATDAAGEISLNVVDAELREVVRLVLEDALGVNYVIDPSVARAHHGPDHPPAAARGPGPDARRDPAHERRGADPERRSLPGGADRAGADQRPDPRRPAAARRAPARLQRGGGAAPLRRGERARPAARAVRAARRHDQARRRRAISCCWPEPSEQLATLQELVAIFDVNWLEGMSFGLFPLETASAAELALELDQIFGDTAEGPLAGVVRVVPIERLNAVLVVSAQPAYLDQAETWVRRLDREGEGEEPQIYVYNVQNARATNLAEVLGEIFGATATTVGEPSLLAPGPRAGRAALDPPVRARRRADPGRAARGAGRGPRAGAPVAPGARAAPGARRSARPSAALEPARRGGGNPRDRHPHHRRRHHQLAGDPGAAARVPQDPAGAGEARRPAAPGADRGDHRRGHLDRRAALRRRVVLPLRRLPAELLAGASCRRSHGAGVFSALFSSDDLVVVLNALEEVTDVDVISSPQLLVLDNQTARLQVGDQVPITVQQATSDRRRRRDPIVNSVELRDTGVILTVTPRVNANGLVILEIQQEVSNVVRSETADRHRADHADHQPAPDQQHGRRAERRDRGARRADHRRPRARPVAACRSCRGSRSSARCSAPGATSRAGPSCW